jgi:hypothetical protein
LLTSFLVVHSTTRVGEGLLFLAMIRLLTVFT